MAKRDIAGLLTGIPSGGIDPMAKLTPQQMRAQIVSGAQQRMGSALRGMFGGDRRTPQEIAVAQAAEKQKADEAKRKKQIARVAEALPPEYSALAQGVVDEVKGALPKALEVLGRKQPEVKPIAGEKPSATDIKTMKILLSTAGEEAKGGEVFGFLGTNWNDAWKKMSPNKKNQVATEVAEAVNKLVDLGFDLSVAQTMAIKKMYTDNLTKTGLFESGESKLKSSEEREEQELQDIRDTANKLLNNPLYSSKPPK